ncbi:sensor histidine kinase [Longispora sp. NPDC051575]|uniref:sensor histidine kinase n=1 Tax=Longispora sp. NPDC051575 TaxID=3154943 RepID=UPI003434803C
MWRRWHYLRFRSWSFDVGVATGVALLALLEQGLTSPAVVGVGLLMAVALLGRRSQPLVTMAAVCVLAPAHLLLRDSVRWFDVAVLIAMYSVVKYRPELSWGLLAGVAAGAGVVVAGLVEARQSDNFWTIVWVVGATTLAVWITAYSMRTRRLYVATLEERAATLERERDHLARLAAADERAVIARELHDVVAHSLSVMIVQADAAGYLVDRSSTRAHDALATIASTGRDALYDMRRVVAVLRGASTDPDSEADGNTDGDLGSEARRQLGLAELDGLVARTTSAGLRVTRETIGTPAGLSAAEELTVYRIVQESLTNALRHAGQDAAVTLRLEYTSERFSIEVSDDGAGRPATTRSASDGRQRASGGHGLVGIRERVAVHGGELSIGPGPGGGWRVAATIPRAKAAVRPDDQASSSSIGPAADSASNTSASTITSTASTATASAGSISSTRAASSSMSGSALSSPSSSNSARSSSSPVARPGAPGGHAAPRVPDTNGGGA